VKFKTFSISARGFTHLFLILIASLFYSARLFGYEKDYYYYRLIFEQIDVDVMLFFAKYEPAFIGINYFTKVIGLSFEQYSFLIIALSLWIKGFLFEKGRFWFLPFMIYFVWLSWLHEGTQIRNALSISFFYLAIYLLANEKNKLSFLAYLTSACFHITSLIFLPIYIFVIYYGLKSINNFSILIISIISSFVIYFLSNYVGYIHPNYEGYIGIGSNFTLLSLKMLPMYLLIWFYRPNNSSTGGYKLHFFICIFAIFASASLFQFGSVPMRVVEFSFLSYLLLANSYSISRKKSFSLLSFILILAILSAVKFLYFDGDYFTFDQDRIPSGI
jgi:hypothetical protein